MMPHLNQDSEQFLRDVQRTLVPATPPPAPALDPAAPTAATVTALLRDRDDLARLATTLGWLAAVGWAALILLLLWLWWAS